MPNAIINTDMVTIGRKIYTKTSATSVTMGDTPTKEFVETNAALYAMQKLI